MQRRRHQANSPSSRGSSDLNPTAWRGGYPASLTANAGEQLPIAVWGARVPKDVTQAAGPSVGLGQQHEVTGSAGAIELAIPLVIWLISSRIEIAPGKFESSHYRRKPGADDPRAAWIFEGIRDQILGDFGYAAEGRPATSSTVWITD
jgi:hypothetical protein